MRGWGRKKTAVKVNVILLDNSSTIMTFRLTRSQFFLSLQKYFYEYESFLKILKRIFVLLCTIS